jgi:FkbM family methyltransferase
MSNRLVKRAKDFWGRNPQPANDPPLVVPAESVPDPWQKLAPHPDQHFGCYTYAQHGDDLIVVAVFDAMGVKHPSYLDVGAHHPFNISNTALLYARGSRGVNIEANPNLVDAFREHRPEDVTLNVGVSPAPGQDLTFYMIDKWSGRNTFSKDIAEEFVRAYPQFQITETISVPVVTIDAVVTQYFNGVFPDFLSIDVEGLDEPVLRSINYEKSAPKVICVETVGPDGARTDGSLKAFLLEKGYFPLMRSGGNTIFVQEQYRSLVC